MKKEDLLALNIDEDTAKKIMEMHGATVTKAKAEVDEKNVTIADLQNQLTSRDKDLKKLQKDNGDNEALKTQISDLQQQYKDLEKSSVEKLVAIQRESALTSLLSEAKVKNPKAVAALLDQEKIVFKDGEISGAKEQIESLQKSDSYLFDLGKKQGGYNPPKGKSSGGEDNFESASKEEDFNFTEFLKNQSEGE